MFTWGYLRVEGNILLRASANGQKVLWIAAGPSYPVSPKTRWGRKEHTKHKIILVGIRDQVLQELLYKVSWWLFPVGKLK